MIGGLLMLAVIAGFVLKGARRAEFADRLSSYRSAKDGTRALYLLAQRAHLPVTRNQRSLEVIEGPESLLILGAQFQGETDEGAHDLFEPADGGVADDDSEDIRERGFNVLRTTRISRDETDKLLQRARDGATVIVAPWGAEQSPLLSALNVTVVRAPRDLGLRTLVPAQPTPYTLGVERIEARVQSFFELPPRALPLLTDQVLHQTAAALVPWGQGRVIILGSPELAMNQALARADNAQFWLSLLRTVTRTGPIAFEEFHHGFTGERSMAEFATRYGLQFAVGQLLLGAILWALSLRRFGRATQVTEERRLGATDALRATSRIYREGRHHAYAAEIIVKEISTQLASRAGVSPTATTAQIGASLETRGLKHYSTALLELAQLAHHAGSDTDVQDVARKAALLRHQLTHTRRTHP